MTGIVITIDGPAGSGKSTTARLVARRLGYRYLDTGAMYRALALKCLREGISLKDERAVTEAARAATISFAAEADEPRVVLDGEDVSADVRAPEVARGASEVGALPGVREVMVAKQREIGAAGAVVAEGRDTGTVVFPNAELKVYMDADLEVRARRRQKDLEKVGVRMKLEEIVRDLRARDERDSKRKVSPLSRAPDAMLVDTSTLTVQEQVEVVVRKAVEILEGDAKR